MGIWRNESIWAKIKHLEKTGAFRGSMVKYHSIINIAISFEGRTGHLEDIIADLIDLR